MTSVEDGGPVGTIYAKVGSRAYAISELDPSTSAACVQGVSPQTCSISVPVGQTVTLVAGEDPVFYESINGPNDPAIAQGAPRQFQSWSSPCATPERGSCTLTPTSDVTIGAVYTRMTPMLAGIEGFEPWKVVLDAPPQAFPGNSGARQSLSVGMTDQDPTVTPARCGNPGVLPPVDICVAIFAPPSSQLNFVLLPLDPALGPPADNGVPYAFTGFGGGCGGTSGCTLTAGTATPPIAYFKWQYLLCGTTLEGAGEYQPPVLPDPSCQLVSP